MLRRSEPQHVANLRRIREIRRHAGGNDAETLARLFEDDALQDDGSLPGRITAILDATAHRWISGRNTWLDVPGLYEVKGCSDRGFRREYRDPWPSSREQVGHVLTALAMALHPEQVKRTRFRRRIRDLAGAPRDMRDEEVAVRLAIGHEKAPDPRPWEPLILWKVRRQFRSATAEDVALFRRALAALGASRRLDLGLAAAALAGIHVGTGMGNSAEDLNLTLVAYRLADLIRRGELTSRQEVAEWLRDALEDVPGAR